MTAHAKLSASGSHTWLKCTGSIKAQESYKNTSSIFAQEGTDAHELAEWCLSKDLNPFDFEGKKLDGSANVITKEMCSNIQTYLDFIALIAGTVEIEKRVDFSDYAPEGFGTADCIIYNPDKSLLTIVDLKYGKGIKVNAYENSQLKLYALGALSDYNLAYKIKEINLVIVQPRLDHIDEFTIKTDDLYRFGEFVKQQAIIALSDDAPRTPGEEQCRWCRHKPLCPELLKLTTDTLLSEFDNCDVTPVNRLTDDQLTQALTNAPLIKSWLSAVEDYVKDKLENGEEFKGFKLVEGRSSRGWTNETSAITALTGLYTHEELFEQSFISVPKAEKLLGKKNMEFMNDLIIKRAGKPTLVSNNDNRKSISVSVDDFD
jgi:hypothetical protein